MTVEIQTPPAASDPLGFGAVAPSAEPAPTRRRRRRDLTLTAEQVQGLTEAIEAAIAERQEMNQRRLARYAKLRGWLETKRHPWDHAANAHIPDLMEKVLANEAGLFNAVLSTRPVVQAVAAHPSAKAAVEQVTDLGDYQFFELDDGERKLDRWIQKDVQDGTVVVKDYWVRDRRPLVDVRRLPRAQGQSVLEQVDQALQDWLESTPDGARLVDRAARDAEGDSWRLTFARPGAPEETGTAEVYDLDDVTLEVVITRRALMDEGPSTQVLRFEDFVIPMRALNPQPITARNPSGAPWVAHCCDVRVDDVRAKANDGFYTLTDAELAALSTRATARTDDRPQSDADAMQREKEAQAGLSAQPQPTAQRQWVRVWEVYAALDVNDDGALEEVVVWLFPDLTPKAAARVRYLTEVMPGVPLERPFAVSHFIPDPDQFYGIGLPELLEALADLDALLLNQAIDGGTLANLPFFIYRKGSQFSTEPIKLEPGGGIPADDVQRDITFPQMPQRDQSFNLNMASLIQTRLDKMSSKGPLQQGQVASGKASALRTTGTTMAILSEGAAQPQQILKRLFMGIRDCFHQRHRLNTRLLPPETVYRRIGVPKDGADAFAMVKDRSDLDGPLTFSFEASLIKANKGLLAQTLESIGQILVSPLMVQLGLVTPEKVYNWARDYIMAHEQDHTRYLARPQGVTDGEPLYAEEVLDRLLTDVPIPASARAYEDPAEHIQKLLTFAQQVDPETGLSMLAAMGPQRMARLTAWMQAVQQRAVQERMQQMAMMQAAGQSQPGQQGGGGPGGVPSMMASPEPQTEQGTADEAANQGPPGGA